MPLMGEQPSPDSAPPRQPQGIFSQIWELELLISGAVVFALLQLPPVLDREFERLAPHVGGFLELAVVYAYWYTGLALYALIASFLLHLTARGYWVGLIGLHSVFPQGVRWENLKYSSTTLRLYRERMPSLPVLIARTDDFCSLIFSFAFVIVFFSAVSLFWVSLLLGGSYTVSELLLGGRYTKELFFLGMTLFMLSSTTISLLDKRLSHKLDPLSRSARFLEKSIELSAYMVLLPLYAPILTVLFSNVRKKAKYLLIILVSVGLTALFLANRLVRSHAVQVDSYSYLPEDRDERAVKPVYYEDQRPADEVFSLEPSIQSDVIRAPYLKLFIPYSADHTERVVAERCPEVEPARKDPAALLRCLARLQPVLLDGKPLSIADFNFYTHPKTGVRGILGYISTQGLAKGGHLLKVGALPRRKSSMRSPRDPYFIRFWI